jgi:hypothetical protein
MKKIKMDQTIILNWGLFAIGCSMVFSSLIIAFMEPNPAAILLTCLGLFIIGYILNIQLTTLRDINDLHEEIYEEIKKHNLKSKLNLRTGGKKLK